jgi:diaminohydroxyphosphoribosylaminopyrimidine deaminase/5-amino-6-(5-phosphoribosylamino)uracil reductase
MCSPQMQRALTLARKGRGCVEPNPMVGCVITRDGEVVGEGFHQQFGGPHAEVHALKAAGPRAAGATAYVTLEPCSHAGKTPPCADALLAAGVARVVVAMVDPDVRVAGRGIERLRAAGVDVRVGDGEAEAKFLLAPYVTLRTKHRPWVIAKWGQTTDGYLALPPGMGRWVTGEESRGRVHAVRDQCDGIAVGIGTVLADDPLLTRRNGSRVGVDAAWGRVVFDRRLRVPLYSRLIQTLDTAPILIATSPESMRTDRAKRLAGLGVECVPAESLAALLAELGARQWTHLLVEGGPTLLASFHAADLVDERWAFIAPTVVGDAPNLPRWDLADHPTPNDWHTFPPESLGLDQLHRDRRTKA